MTTDVGNHNEIAEAIEAGKTYDQLTDYSDMPTHETHWRKCYFRAGRDNLKWRLRDERGGVASLWLVEGYVGRAPENWLDGGSHGFTDACCWVHPQTRIAHFFQPGEVCVCGSDHNANRD